ncbi:MAG: hypothetical protein FWC67_00470 [Defluviitaleaceae bacterium]|nr:hypothetical protein [Defluviitaleaceae bacterium]
MSNKAKQILGVTIVLLVGAGALAAIFTYSLRISADIERPFVPERRQTAQRLYRDTIGLDIERNYPTNPRDVVELYIRSVFFLYGDFIAYESMFMEVINFQRMLVTEELMQGITPQQQFANLQQSLYYIDQTGISLRPPQVTSDALISYYDSRRALVNVVYPFLFYDQMYRIYYLVQDEHDNRWRIHSWQQTDETFRSIGDGADE